MNRLLYLKGTKRYLRRPCNNSIFHNKIDYYKELLNNPIRALSVVNNNIIDMKVNQTEDGIRLDKFIRKKVQNPMSHIFRSIRKKEIKVTFSNGKRVPKSNKNDFKLDSNMQVKIFNSNFILKDEEILRIDGDMNEMMVSDEESNSNNDDVVSFIKFETLYEDDDILIINKPAEFAVHDGSKTNINVTDELLKKYNDNKIYIVHRLDKSTSGCLMFAKNRKTAQYFSKEFKNHGIKKYYIGTVFLPFGEPVIIDNNNNNNNSAARGNNNNNVKKTKKKKSTTNQKNNTFNDKYLVTYALTKTSYGVRPAYDDDNNNDTDNNTDATRTKTNVFPLELLKQYDNNDNNTNNNNDFIMKKQNIIFQPITGFKHQLRALSAFSLKTPIVGDKKYMRFMEKVGDNVDMFYDDKLHLHAWILQFYHPITKKKITIETKIPEYISKYSEKPSRKIILDF